MELGLNAQKFTFDGIFYITLVNRIDGNLA